MKLIRNFSLKNYNTFGIDVLSKYFVEVSSENQLLEILTDDHLKSVPKMVIGGGSNILFSSNFDGIIIKNSISGINLIDEDDENVFVKAGAGIIWNEFVQYCVNRNFGGVENLSLIPGTVGAAPIQNIGAYGQELKNVFNQLSGLYIDSGEKASFNKNQCGFGYRNSIFKNQLKNKFIVTDVIFKLSKHPSLNLDYGGIRKEIENSNIKNISIKNVSEIISDIRRKKLPDPAELGNAGSFFKNPEIEKNRFKKLKEDFPEIIGYEVSAELIKIPAGWLIEKTGLKGKRVGNTGTFPKQALVIVNYGNASSDEILKLKNLIQKSVFEKFQIQLEEEVNII